MIGISIVKVQKDGGNPTLNCTLRRDVIFEPLLRESEMVAELKIRGSCVSNI